MKLYMDMEARQMKGNFKQRSFVGTKSALETEKVPTMENSWKLIYIAQ